MRILTGGSDTEHDFREGGTCGTQSRLPTTGVVILFQHQKLSSCREYVTGSQPWHLLTRVHSSSVAQALVQPFRGVVVVVHVG